MPEEHVRAVEAILMVAEQPVEVALLAQLLELPATQIEGILRELQTGYEVDGRGFILANVAGGWRYQSHPDLAPYIERFVLEGQTARLSAAALETMAIIAYKQPISRAQIAAIRGVNVDGVVRTLEQRGYIREVGRDPGPGNPSLFGTTELFLERLGLASLDDLPPLATFVPGAEVVEQLEAGLRVEVDDLTLPSDEPEQAVETDDADDATDASDPDGGTRAPAAADDTGERPSVDDLPE